MVAGSRILLEGTLVFFIDHDQTELGCGRKNGAPCTDDHRGAATGNPGPLPVPLDVAQVTVQDRDVAEAGSKPRDGLRRERNFRNQDNRLPAESDHFANGLKIDFGFATPGNAVH